MRICGICFFVNFAAAAYVASLQALHVVYYEPLKLLADNASRRLSVGDHIGSGSSAGVMLSLTEIDAVFGNVIFIHAIHKNFFSQFKSVFTPASLANEVTVTEFAKVFTAMFTKVSQHHCAFHPVCFTYTMNNIGMPISHNVANT